MNSIKKTVLLATDGIANIQIGALATRLNQVCKHLRFESSSTPINFEGSQVSYPETYKNIAGTIAPLRKHHSLILIATDRPYDNNYFWESDDLVVIFSFSGWMALTNLSKNNGMVEFINSMLASSLDPTALRHEDITGCVNDFMWDKRGIDARMRSGTICRACYSKYKRQIQSSATTRLESFDCTVAEGFEDLTTLMDEVSQASKREVDILTRWEAKAGVPQAFDVFLCHNSNDKQSVRGLYGELTRRGLKPWFDEEHLRPGVPWQRELERSIPEISSVAIIVGPNGRGPWQDIELDAFLREFAKRACPVIPVLLADAGGTPELPLFLQAFTWVDFRKSEPNPWKRLIWGITGVKPA